MARLVDHAQGRSLHVVMFPDYRANNPYQSELARALAAQGVQVDFPSGYRRGLHFARTLRQPHWRQADWIHLHWPEMYLRGRGSLARWLHSRKLRLDLRLALSGNRRLAWTVHNLGSHDGKGDTVERSFNRWLARKASVLFVHDDNLVTQAATHLGIEAGKIRVIPHGHYRDVYGEPPEKAVARKRIGVGQDKRLALFLGMLRPYKGLDELLDIWPSVQATVPEAHLLIAGGGRDSEYISHVKERCQKLSEVSLEARFLSDEELPLYYGAADVAVFPFRAITTSGSLILALSYDCPVVTPDVPSTSSMLKFQRTLLYAAGNPQNLCASLLAGLSVESSAWKEEFANLRAYNSWAVSAKVTAEAYRSP